MIMEMDTKSITETDNDLEDKEIDEDDDEIKPVKYRRKIVWRNVFAMSLLHLLAVYCFITTGLNPSMPWYFFLWPDIIGKIAALGILAGSHRLWSHRSFKAHISLRIFLMILQTMALQNDIYDWCRDHRLHHKHSDTDADPYNARRGFFFSHCGWLMCRKHPEVIRKGKTIDLSDVWADPVVRFQRRFYIPLVILFWGIIPSYITHYATGLPLFECFLSAVVLRYVLSLHYAWLVNSAAHLYGYQMYDKTLEPRENRLVVYASFGEGYHNYHHAFPWDYSASEHGWSKCFNLTTGFIDLCAMIGLAYDLKKADNNIVAKRIERTGDLASKQEFFNISTMVDYVTGFIFSYHAIILACCLRFLINGKI